MRVCRRQPLFSQLADLHEQLPGLVESYGYWLVALAIGLESMGLPLPGETILIAASLYAGHTHRLNISLVLLAGMAGAIIGDNIGYWIGREAGYRLLVRHGHRVGITPARLRLARYLFALHGGKVVFFGRFVAVLRALAGLMAGALRMEWRMFLVCNIAAGIVWVGSYGMAAYLLGGQIRNLLGPIGIFALVSAVVIAGLGFRTLRRRHASLQAIADRDFADAGPTTADLER